MVYDKVVLMGTGRVANECLKELMRYCKCEQLTCVEAEIAPFSLIKASCEKSSIQYICISDKVVLEKYLSELEGNILIISAHNSYIFPKVVLAKRNIKVINFHNAYLPYYKGRNAPTWCIFNMEEYAGVTWHEVVSDIDAGNIILQDKITIGPMTTALDVLIECVKKGTCLFRDNVECLLEDNYEVVAQEMDKGKMYYAKDIPNKGKLNLAWPVEKISAFLRAMDYKNLSIMPKPTVDVLGKEYVITSYILKKSEEGRSGIFLMNHNEIIVENNGLYVKCGLEVNENE